MLVAIAAELESAKSVGVDNGCIVSFASDRSLIISCKRKETWLVSGRDQGP